MTTLHALVTFQFPDTRAERLRAMARKIDALKNEDIPERYTIEQAFQVVWHSEPEWLHKEVLVGWIMEQAGVGDTEVRPVWPLPAAPKT